MGGGGGGVPPLLALGQDLRDYLTAQFSPPSGVGSVLGFLAGGVAVEPQSFLSGNPPRPNPLLVDNWLNEVVDLVTPVVDGVTGYSFLTASELMQEIVTFATPTAPIGSDAANAIGRLKSMAANAADIGMVRTAPIGWYDASQVMTWPRYSSRATTGPDAPAPAVPLDRVLWNWRTLPMPAFELSARSLAADIPRAPVGSMTVDPSVRRAMSQLNPNVLVVASQQAHVSPVQASSLSLSLNYLLVVLSRAPWWSDILVDDDRDWFFVQQHAGQLVPGDQHRGQVVGVPVALILTANVEVAGSWTEQDRQAAASSSHLGPWALEGATFQDAASGETTLSIPGMAAIACVYQLLPALPPADDPALAPDSVPAAPQVKRLCTVTVDVLHIRSAPSSQSTEVASFPRGTVLNYVEVVAGESVDGNASWGHSQQGHYYWMGGTDRPNG